MYPGSLLKILQSTSKWKTTGQAMGKTFPTVAANLHIRVRPIAQGAVLLGTIEHGKIGWLPDYGGTGKRLQLFHGSHALSFSLAFFVLQNPDIS
jgi:hypothetical protein